MSCPNNNKPGADPKVGQVLTSPPPHTHMLFFKNLCGWGGWGGVGVVVAPKPLALEVTQSVSRSISACNNIHVFWLGPLVL